MNRKLYRLMNWPAIESIIYSDGDRPNKLLGAHREGNGILIQTFLPEAGSVSVVLKESGERVPMELADEDGFYACFLPRRKESTLSYCYEITDRSGAVRTAEDCYRFPSRWSPEDEKSFAAGIHYTVGEKLGAHLMEYDGISGTGFAVYAPGCARVSVVGDFNGWDGRVHQMSRSGESDVFELFIPGVSSGACYQYELRNRRGSTVRKSDPYARMTGGSPLHASIVTESSRFAWTDAVFLSSRAERRGSEKPFSVYEFDPAAFSDFRTARKILPAHVKELGFTAVQFRPGRSDSNALFAPDPRFGSPEELRTLVDAFHAVGVEVLFEWNPCRFDRSPEGLEQFSLSPVYESSDPLRAFTPDGRGCYFDVGRPQVSNYLLAAAFFQIEALHADGLAFDDLAPMLYLDYGKQESGWTPNLYGGAENPDAVEFLKHLNSMLQRRNPGAVTTAQESAAWSGVTGSVFEDRLGFFYKTQDGWKNSHLRYLSVDPLFREGVHELLLEDLLYQYTESFLLPLTAKDIGPGAETVLSAFPGSREEKFAALRQLIAMMMVHPGAKMLNLGETKAQTRPEPKSPAAGVFRMVRDLNRLYRTLPALHLNDSRPDGLEWIRQMADSRCMLCAIRRGARPGEFIFIVINNAGVEWKTEVGVPYDGNYRQIFCSAAKIYGGEASVPRAASAAVRKETDGRGYSLSLVLPPVSVSLYRYEE
ncbi:GlgB N-terminal domain-containing protein [Lachnoclostridium sp. Marseille-P6806]|uniref:GlgB N-terminal domain-containing protein n=1 Tax=Lachnoclostridium sp. Marseille-P6806 TaxID=2364793 RepID=UPI001031E502|nr:alpha amylase C-terminal domain-containing protein [Lachnoclostridium sp. Marseille-P6806]